MSNTELSELDRALFIAAALRGYRLQRMRGDDYGLYRRNAEAVELMASGLTFRDVANRCGAYGSMTLRAAAERDGLTWPDSHDAFLALAESV